MASQSDAWSAAASRYEQEFVDPYHDGVRNPLPAALEALAQSGARTVADLGCGIGPLLPTLARLFARVLAIDFAPGMLQRARQRVAGLGHVEFFQRDLTDLADLAGMADVAVAVNSLVLPDPAQLECALRQAHEVLKPGGVLLGIVPAMDAVHYHTMLLVDRARRSGMPIDKARQNAAQHGEHALYDFAFGQFRYLGLEQHFWQPFEVRYRLRRAGFRRVRLRKVRLAWEQFACAAELARYPPLWDWFFRAEV
jgi:SAM-dependent methyltransferase